MALGCDDAGLMRDVGAGPGIGRTCRRRFDGVWQWWTAAFCFCVGLVPVLCGAEKAPDDVRVVTYNVENWLSMDRHVDGKRIKYAPKPDSEKAAVVRIIASLDPDVVGLTEVGSVEDLEDIQKRLRIAGYDLPHFEWHDAADEVRRVALLSRHPIVQRNSQKDIVFDLVGIRHPMARGILDVTLAVGPEYRLRLLGVHLKSKREVEEFNEAEMRSRELLHLGKYVRQILEKDPQTNLLVYGDFNETKNAYSIRQFLGKRGDRFALTDIQLADRLGDRWTYYWRYADIYSRIDYLVASPGLVPEIDRAGSGIDRSPDWAEASDHRALFTTIIPSKE